MDDLGFSSGGIHATTTTATDSASLIVSPHDFALRTLRATIAAAFRFILYRNAFDHNLDVSSPTNLSMFVNTDTIRFARITQLWV